MKKFIKKNIKIILGFILGLIWSGGIVYVAGNGYLFDSDEVSYDNTASGLESTNVQDALDELYANSDAYLAGLNAAHPIGSIFMTVNSNYNTAAKVGAALGGTWEAFGTGKTLVGIDTSDTDFDTIGETGGGKTTSYTPAGTNNGGAVQSHTLTINEMPSHTHGGIGMKWYASDTDWSFTLGGSTPVASMGTSNATGGSQGHSHGFTQPTFTGTQANISTVQPYVTVYMYKRTA